MKRFYESTQLLGFLYPLSSKSVHQVFTKVAISETIPPMNLCLIVAEVRLIWLFIGKFWYNLRKDKHHISQLHSSHLYIGRKA